MVGVDSFKKPETVRETKLNEGFVRKLILKNLAKFEPTGNELSDITGLGLGIIEKFLLTFKEDDWLYYEGQSPIWHQLRCVLTPKGRKEAEDILSVDRYTGIAPVSYLVYKQVMSDITKEGYRVDITKEKADHAFEGVKGAENAKKILTMATRVRRGVIVYGPSGNGKTFITSKMAELSPPIYLPRCVEYGGKVFLLYDEDFHKALPQLEQPEDPRWVKIYAPFVFTGAELTTAKLDAIYNPERGAYIAPPQVKAHGGIFLVDDLGRQIEPHNIILNRLIVPMENKKDIIHIDGVPIELFTDFIPVFSTNVSIAIFDEAHLRRAPFTAYIGPPEIPVLIDLLKEFLGEFDITYDESSFEPLKAAYKPRDEGGMGLQASFATPRDLAQIIYGLSKHHGKDMLDSDLMEEAMNHYILFTLQKQKVPLSQIGMSLTEEITTVELTVEGGEEGIKEVLSTHPGVKNFVNIQGKVFIDMAKGSTATKLIQELEGQTTIKDLKVIGKMSQPIVDESKLNIT